MEVVRIRLRLLTAGAYAARHMGHPPESARHMVHATWDTHPSSARLGPQEWVSHLLTNERQEWVSHLLASGSRPSCSSCRSP